MKKPQDATKPWPQLRGDVEKIKDHYLFKPEKNAPEITIDFTPQGEGDLGDRLNRAATQGFKQGFKKVAVIGADCPSCGSRWINTAFLQTKKENITIGPTPDGGYYLLATSNHHPELFLNIPWSAPNTREKTIQAAKNKNLTTNLLPELTDIDDVDSWELNLQTTLAQKLRTALKKQP